MTGPGEKRSNPADRRLALVGNFAEESKRYTCNFSWYMVGAIGKPRADTTRPTTLNPVASCRPTGTSCGARQVKFSAHTRPEVHDFIFQHVANITEKSGSYFIVIISSPGCLHKNSVF